MSENSYLEEAKRHIFPIGFADYKARTGRSLEDVDLEHLLVHVNVDPRGDPDYMRKRNAATVFDLAIETMYSLMKSKEIDDAICLNIQWIEWGAHDSSEIKGCVAYALGLKRIDYSGGLNG